MDPAPHSAQSMAFCAIMENVQNVSLRKTDTVEGDGFCGRIKQFRGVLVAISIPIFTSQLEKSREATDATNERAAKAAAVTAYLSEDPLFYTAGSGYNNSTTVKFDAASGKSVASTATVTGYGKGTTAGDVNADNAGKYLNVTVDKDGNVTLAWA